MKSKDIKELSIEELGKKLRDARADVLDLRLRKKAGQLEKTHEVRLKKNEVARYETILSQKKAVAQ